MSAERTFQWSKAFYASGAIAPRRIIMGDVGDTAGTRAAQATGPNALLIGVGYIPDSYRDPIVMGQTPPAIQVLNGHPFDCQMGGIVEVDAAANMGPWVWVTSDANGRAVPAADGNHSIGFTTRGVSNGNVVTVAIHQTRLSFGANVTSSPAELNLFDNAPANAVFTIGTEAANVINVAAQLRNADNQNIVGRRAISAYLSGVSTGGDLAAAPSGGVAIGANGLLTEPIADRSFQAITGANGLFDINITEATVRTLHLVLVFPSGAIQVSSAIQFV